MNDYGACKFLKKCTIFNTDLSRLYKKRYEEANIRFKDHFNNRLYFRSIIHIIYKNNA